MEDPPHESSYQYHPAPAESAPFTVTELLSPAHTVDGFAVAEVGAAGTGSTVTSTLLHVEKHDPVSART